MRVIEPSYRIEAIPSYEDALQAVERAARTCYKSEGAIAPGSAERLVRACICRGHESVVEHVGMTVRFIVDRGISHELVRHRLASFSQTSTRYVDGMKEGIAFIKPLFFDVDSEAYRIWEDAMAEAEDHYRNLRIAQVPPEQARSVLPNSTKTEIVTTPNFREWRLIFKLRTQPAAHPQMRQVTQPLLRELKSSHPAFFDDIEGPRTTSEV